MREGETPIPPVKTPTRTALWKEKYMARMKDNSAGTIKKMMRTMKKETKY
jgi:hypothetical protein